MTEENKNAGPKGPILHVIVVGFHHKKGCQVEYSFPPLMPGGSYDSNECPPGWKYLPTLALPDGSHNFTEDTVYFHLPSLTNPKQTVYGISCFRQIPVEKVTNRTADITRGTVQKSVCVLSTLPLYGQIQVKMALITHAYFEEGDFSKVSLLQDTFTNLNDCLSEEMLNTSQVFVGLSPQDLILQFKHKALLMFKLMLLERRVLFFKSPVQHLCSTILSLLSLHPGMIEKGLIESACVKPSRPMSPIPDFSSDVEDKKDVEKVELTSTNTNISSVPSEKGDGQDLNVSRDTEDNKGLVSEAEESKLVDSLKTTAMEMEKEKNEDRQNSSEDLSSNKALNGSTQREVDDASLTPENPSEDSKNAQSDLPNSQANLATHALSMVPNLKGKLTGAISYWAAGRDKSPSPEKVEIAVEADMVGMVRSNSDEKPSEGSVEIKVQSTLSSVASLTAEECGCPMALFTKGYLCHPYLSLPYLDLLSDVKVRGYVIGATNVLFKQKKQVADVIIEIDDMRIETQDLELRKQLHLTTQDLRFADYIVRQVSEERTDVFLDGVRWEGGDEWIRAQFRLYLICLLRTSLMEDGCKDHEYFNSSFMAAWKSTHSYKLWESSQQHKTALLKVPPGHPFSGQLSVSDMKLRLSHTMQSTEGGRKLNQAMTSTGRAVAHTGRAMGGAISQAKGALSSWWTTLTAAQSPESQNPAENPEQSDSGEYVGNVDNNEEERAGDEASHSDSELDEMKVRQRNACNSKGSGGKADPARHSCLPELSKDNFNEKQESQEGKCGQEVESSANPLDHNDDKSNIVR
ncbi:late secretory pathway protein AVL9 homolog [Ischnura elegans]|uniref:late secretory pathway protein AVL9 homolog n=1 Tax=Ischnura elegans TaxID=197161 RepID=UPI001ED86CDB|nr:late secretory pathway protein AVL9 homolog [Ischnura elegans]